MIIKWPIKVKDCKSFYKIVFSLLMIRNPFHLVEYRPWPFCGAFGAFIIVIGLASWFHFLGLKCLALGVLVVLFTIYQWFRDIIREATFMGFHNIKVLNGIRLGIILFIVSEIFFFFRFFWSFFHSRLSPTPELGCIWPPVGLVSINPYSVPLLNTAILLASGVTVTWAHHRLINNNRRELITSLLITITLGLYFSVLQAEEYIESSFCISDSVYGRVFYVATGFHGLHVIIGSLFLLVCLIRRFNYHYSSEHHFGFEAAAWYWHFVDVVWIFLYVCVYIWGS